MSGGPDIPLSVIILQNGEPGQMRRCYASLQDCLPAGSDVRVVEGERPNFVENCNRAIEKVLPSGRDVLLLHADAETTPGFLAEMHDTLRSHERHAVVSPRSNNAGILSIPVNEPIGRGDSFSLWKEIKGRLPRFQTVPTCAGFCMLVRNSVLRSFGMLDPVYESGYAAEHDFVCRINRFGYSAATANRAFVFHDE
jgi:GT2 family glycosyltransferase